MPPAKLFAVEQAVLYNPAGQPKNMAARSGGAGLTSRWKELCGWQENPFFFCRQQGCSGWGAVVVSIRLFPISVAAGHS